MANLFKITRKDHIVIFTLNNPPANTWTIDGLLNFKKEVDKFSDDNTITALILTSENQKFFSAGADLNIFKGASYHDAHKIADIFGQAFETLTDFKGVTIAVINGYAMGGGLEVALACDLRIVTTTTKLGLPEAKVGLLPCAGGTQNLTALVGEGWAKRIILCGEMISGPQAVSIGLAEDISENPLQKAYDWASMTKNVSPDSLHSCKNLIQMGRLHPQRANLTNERTLFVELFHKQNTIEGVEAFLEKRPPNWTY